MSSCIILQQKNNIFIASDTAISSTIGGEKIRLSNSAEKLFQKDDSIIFCSGNMEIATKCSRFIKNMDIVNIEKIQNYISSFYIDGMFEIFIVKTCNGYVESYQLSSYNNFKPIRRIVNDTEIFAVGYNTEKMLNSFEKYLMSTDVISAIKNSFNDNICVEVGGNLDIFYYYNNEIYDKHFSLIDDTECLLSDIKREDCNFVIAETILGRLILGEKLVITSDDGLFYVGNGETTEQQNRKEFGLYVYNNIGGVDRIFLGLSTDDDGVRRAKLRLKDASGNQVVLSEEGIVQTSQFVCWDNVSPGYPMRIPYFCDDGVKENRKIILSMVFEKYRAFERGMTAGGSMSTSSAGGGGTSYAGGGGTSASGGGGTSGSGGSTSLSGGGTTSAADGSSNITSTSGGGGAYYKTTTSTAPSFALTPEKQQTSKPLTGVFADHTHNIHADIFLHRHDITIDIPAHSHGVTVSVPAHTHKVPDHTHTIGNHTHQIYAHTHNIPDHTHQISDHTHTIDTTHSHNLEYAIFEQESRCSGVRVYVNNVLVNTGAGINSDVDLDVTKYVKIGQRNDIRIETKSNGRISCNIFTKSFVAF